MQKLVGIPERALASMLAWKFRSVECWWWNYSRLSSVQNLAAQKNYNNLNMTMREAIASRSCCVEGVLKCYRHETLETVIDRIAKAEVGPPRNSCTATMFKSLEAKLVGPKKSHF